MTTPTPRDPAAWISALALATLLAAGPWTTACEQPASDDDSAGDDDAGDDDAGDDDAGDDDAGGELDLSVCASENGPFSLTIDNPYLPFSVGAVHVLEGLEGGVDPIRLQFSVLDETVEVAGVPTRVVVEEEWEDDVYAGEERHLVVQAPDGTVCYYGVDGGWQAGSNDALAGILMPGAPAVGQVFDMIHTSVQVETVEISQMGESVVTPAGTFDDTVTFLEQGPSIKKYAAGIGMIYDDGILLTEH